MRQYDEKDDGTDQYYEVLTLCRLIVSVDFHWKIL